MTCIARDSRWNVVGRLGHPRSALDVTGGAAARGHAGVIKGRGNKGLESRVAGIARGRRRDMVCRFAERIHAGERTVVTICALPRQDALRGGMRERRGQERTSCRVTRIAREGCRNVVGRLGHPRSALDVTGGAAARHYSDMIKTRAHPSGGSMARVARCCGWCVIRWFARDDGAVMALRTLLRNYADMTENHHVP